MIGNIEEGIAGGFEQLSKDLDQYELKEQEKNENEN